MPVQFGGKQIADDSIEQSKLNLKTSEIINDTDPATKEYVDNKIVTSK
jgi:hypothetical protein